MMNKEERIKNDVEVYKATFGAFRARFKEQVFDMMSESIGLKLPTAHIKCNHIKNTNGDCDICHK